MITVLAPPYSGLGNLLFQYAYARYLAIKNGAEILMDFSLCFNRYEFFSPKAAKHLNHFNLKANIMIPGLLRRFGMGTLHKLKIIPNYANLVTETSEGFSPEMLEKGDGTTLYGYFQSAKYFQEIADVIHAELQPVLSDTSDAFMAFQNQINDSISVAIHVRRQDYLRFSHFDICTPRYYTQASRVIKGMISRPCFFVFSDDLPWAQENILMDNAVFVDLPEHGNRTVLDLYLMSLCKHQIIANSTFSWWGAWLNRNPQKVVLSPATWNKNPARNARIMRHTLPDEWIKIPL